MPKLNPKYMDSAGHVRGDAEIRPDGTGRATWHMKPSGRIGQSYPLVATRGFMCGCTVLRDQGATWTWGRNNFGQLGTGNLTARSSPVSVASDERFVEAHGGYESFVALDDEGAVWGWGRNSWEQPVYWR